MLEMYENLQKVGAVYWNGGELCPIFNDVQTGDLLVEDVITDLAYYLPELPNESNFLETEETNTNFIEFLAEQKKMCGAVGAIMRDTCEHIMLFPTNDENTFAYGISLPFETNKLDVSKLPKFTIELEADLDDISQ